jgi:hypothetical protein
MPVGSAVERIKLLASAETKTTLTRMAVQTFRDDDTGYEVWLAVHPSGWVVNARRSSSPAGAEAASTAEAWTTHSTVMRASAWIPPECEYHPSAHCTR